MVLFSFNRTEQNVRLLSPFVSLNHIYSYCTCVTFWFSFLLFFYFECSLMLCFIISRIDEGHFLITVCILLSKFSLHSELQVIESDIEAI